MTQTNIKEGKSNTSLEQKGTIICISGVVFILLVCILGVRLEKEINIEEEVILIYAGSLYSRENVIHHDCIGEVRVWSPSENVTIFDAHYDESSKIKGTCTLYIEKTKLRLKWL